MVEAKPADPSRDATPKLVAVPEPEIKQTPAAVSRPQSRREPEPTGVSSGVFAVIVGLLVLAVSGFVVQTQRVQDQAEQIAALSGRVEGLQVQLSAANTQLATYDMQLALVRTSVASMFEQLTDLNELVNSNPFPSQPTPAPTER